jgi:hypothetical protein
MDLQALWQTLETSSVGDFIASSAWAFPAVESAHVIAIVTVAATIGIMDLRLLGWAGKDWTVTEVSDDTLKWTWGAFILSAITGTLLFVSKAHVYAREPWFLAKLGLFVIAGANMAVFHYGTAWKHVGDWNAARTPPRAAVVAGVLSLGIWTLVIVCGRFIGFTLGQYE